MEYILGKHDRGSPLALTDSVRRQHIHLIGKTGSGKSTLLYNLMCSDLERGRGFALLDPHGDLARAVADAVPKSRIGETIYFDPLDTHAVSYNPLFDIAPFHRATVAAHVVASFKHIWHEAWGPRLEYILTNAIRLLLDNRGTLTDIPRLLRDTRYRSDLLRRCTDPHIRDFWTQEYAGYTDRLRANHPPPPLQANTRPKERTLTSRQGGHDWKRKPPLRGSLFNANSHLRVLIFTASEARIAAMMEPLDHCLRSDQFLFRAKPHFAGAWEVPPVMTDLLHQPWQTTKGTFFINRP